MGKGGRTRVRGLPAKKANRTHTRGWGFLRRIDAGRGEVGAPGRSLNIPAAVPDDAIAKHTIPPRRMVALMTVQRTPAGAQHVVLMVFAANAGFAGVVD